MSFVSTVAEPAAGCFWQVIHKVCSAVTDLDIHLPIANSAAPVKADLPGDRSFVLARMLTIKPAWCVGSTVMLWHW